VEKKKILVEEKEKKLRKKIKKFPIELQTRSRQGGLDFQGKEKVGTRQKNKEGKGHGTMEGRQNGGLFNGNSISKNKRLRGRKGNFYLGGGGCCEEGFHQTGGETAKHKKKVGG